MVTRNDIACNRIARLVVTKVPYKLTRIRAHSFFICALHKIKNVDKFGCTISMHTYRHSAVFHLKQSNERLHDRAKWKESGLLSIAANTKGEKKGWDKILNVRCGEI